MGEKILVNFQVDEDRKTEWAKKADENGRSLSGFIRSSVERRIAEMDGETSRGTGAGRIDNSRLSDLVESNQALQGEIREVKDSLNRIEKAVEQPSESAQQLMTDVYRCLPSKKQVGTSKIGIDGETVTDRGTVLSGRTGDIADHLDEAPYRIQDAIEELKETTSMVAETVIDGERRYYRRA